ncbi:CidA/LrgA family protein [Brevibacillus borstelensis]|uniref:CidA/LrgA family protein n=1 Tax=Brevibacillus borstelensis TaxID=45462 RepID=UPI0004F27E47|nr:CidA/LrgA family protein [Brevibacillus borstelensis]KKX55931.1 effector of murein hydrolase LrgA [Brevibacillus borstelensis cifa_chp40]MED1743309.1 CidA/LrgA family protein [Brevibacillus borstelensis]NOU57712.1 CidA/LrgA family protein [Brevibacillus borstelensis]
MKTIKGIILLLAFYGIGTMASQWLHIPLPGNLLGMLLLTLALITGVVKLDWVEEASHLLIRHMMLFFVPILVGVAAYLQTVAQNPLPLILAMVLGPAFVMIVSGKVIQWYLDRKREKTAAPTPAEAERRSLDA